MKDDEQTEASMSLRDEIAATLRAMRPTDGEDIAVTDQINGKLADSIMHLLNERGHYMPGCPPASEILQDAQQFAGQFMLAMLCVRLLRMMNTRIVTPESKGLERWLNDYIDGKNHGPVGKPMFWPGGLPGLAQQLRDWGYAPTETRPQFVARAKPESITTLQ